MTTSDQIALLALIVSLISFWLSYRLSHSSRLLATAEKRSQVHISLVETLLHAQEQKSILREVRDHAPAIEPLLAGHEEIEERFTKIFQSLEEREEELHQILQSIEERLTWVRSEKTNDPVLLEKYHSYIKEVGLRMKHLAQKISTLEVCMKDIYDDLIG